MRKLVAPPIVVACLLAAFTAFGTSSASAADVITPDTAVTSIPAPTDAALKTQMAAALRNWTAYETSSVDWRNGREKQLTDSAINWPDRTGKTHSPAPKTRDTHITLSWDGKHPGAWLSVGQMDKADVTLDLMGKQTHQPNTGNRRTFDTVLRHPAAKDCGPADQRFPLAARCLKSFPVDLVQQCQHRPTETAWVHTRCGTEAADRKITGGDNQTRMQLRNWQGDAVAAVSFHYHRVRNVHPTANMMPANMNPATTLCDEAFGQAEADNSFGLLATFDVSEYYCWDGANVTVQPASYTGSVYQPLVEFNGFVSDPVGAAYMYLSPYPTSGFHESAQGDICLGTLPLTGICISDWNPILTLDVHSDGTTYSTSY